MEDSLLQTVASTSYILLAVDYVLNYSVMDFSRFSYNTLHWDCSLAFSLSFPHSRV